jgi:signal peptidase I
MVGGDRIVALKMLRPLRWDLIVYVPPFDAETVYVARLVGLPGESVEIRDGEVWIDGKLSAKPLEIDKLVYAGQLNKWNPFDEEASKQPWGPAPLGEDEYLVLGDFSRSSFDSRLWTEGAPDHPPYAVPAENIVGVVTHLYWPPSRWRVFR